jgi:hypothetical protein
MSRWIGNAAGDGYGQRNLLQIADEEKGALWIPARGFGWHNRGPHAVSFQWADLQQWTWSGFMCGDRSTPFGLLGQDAAEMDYFGPWSLGLGGKNSPYYLTGICKDASDNPLGGAIVQAFVTLNDSYVSETRCDDRGYFQAPCFEQVPHYLVAYYPGSPDKAGASVNTLVPTRG